MYKVGVNETFLWETQSWPFDHPDVKPLDPGSNSLTLMGKEVAVASALPPLPPKCKKKSWGCKSEKRSGDGGSESKRGGDSELDHGIHIWTERERRKKMRNMFSNLHALLPQLPPKADKSTIVDEAVNYIKSLEQELLKLQRRKLERLHGFAALSYETTYTALPKAEIDTREASVAGQVSTSNNNLGINQTNLSVSRFAPPEFQTWTSPNVVLSVCGGQAQYNICAIKKLGLFTTICYLMEKNKIDVVHASVSSDNFRTMYLVQAQARMVHDVVKTETTLPVEEMYKQAAAEIMLWVSF